MIVFSGCILIGHFAPKDYIAVCFSAAGSSDLLDQFPNFLYQPEADPTWKPKQMVGTTLNIEAHEPTLKNTHTDFYWCTRNNGCKKKKKKEKPMMNDDDTRMHPLKTVLLTLGCALELL